MLIIVENDHTGTLADQVADRIRKMHPGDTVAVMRPNPEDTSWERFVDPLVSYRPRPRLERTGLQEWSEVTLHHVVCDGWHWSQWVADTETRNIGSVLTPGVMGYLDRFLRSRGAMVVRMFDDRDPTTHGYAGIRRDRLFDHLARESHISWIGHYAEDFQPVGSLIAYAQSMANSAFIMRNLGTYTGPPNPVVLLLGNARSDRDRVGHPAFMPYAGSPGEFLADALDGITRITYGKQADISIGVANACDGDSLENLVDYLSPVVVVPLGTAAFRAYEKLPYHMVRDIRMFTMPHPAIALHDPGSGDYGNRVGAYSHALAHKLFHG